MDSVNIFAIASKHSRWLAVRQTTVAQNIANANTPGYKALDVEPFEATMSATRLEMKRTSSAHLNISGEATETNELAPGDSWQIVHSGNTVNLEQQLMRASEVSGAHSLNTTAVKAFHRMLIMSSRG